MIITLDYDNDQIRIDESAPAASFAPVNGQTLRLIEQVLSEIFNRLDTTPLDVCVRRQDDGELLTLEEW